MASSQQNQRQAPLPCPAWIWSNNSNVHVAKDRSWFGDDYVDVDSFVDDPLGGQAKVVGFGTVHLPTKASPTQSGPDSHGTLHLEKVLHIPDSMCNIIGRPILFDYDLETGGSGPGSRGSITKASDGSPVAFFKPGDDAKFFEVQLSEPPIGPQVGPSPFDRSCDYWFQVEWPDSEREKFASLQASD